MKAKFKNSVLIICLMFIFSAVTSYSQGSENSNILIEGILKVPDSFGVLDKKIKVDVIFENQDYNPIAQTTVELDKGNKYASFILKVPKNEEGRLCYFYNSTEYPFVAKGYYYGKSTTFKNNFKLMKLVSDVKNVELDLIAGQKIEGKVKIPSINSYYKRSTMDEYISIYAYNVTENCDIYQSGIHSCFKFIRFSKSSFSYSLIVPRDIGNYRISYNVYSYDFPEEGGHAYKKAYYAGKSCITNPQKALLLKVDGNDIKGIDFNVIVSKKIWGVFKKKELNSYYISNFYCLEYVRNIQKKPQILWYDVLGTNNGKKVGNFQFFIEDDTKKYIFRLGDEFSANRYPILYLTSKGWSKNIKDARVFDFSKGDIGPLTINAPEFKKINQDEK